MHGSNNVEFMGVLVDRQYTSSQRCVQLVFETAEGIRLSLSRNAGLVRSLKLGLTYNVKGPEHTVGQKRYIHEPTATLVPVNATTPLFRRYKILIPAAIGLVVLLGGVSVLAYTSRSSADTSSQPTANEQKPARTSVSETTTTPTDTAMTTSEPAPDTESATTTAPQQQTRAASTPSTKKTAATPTPKTTAPSTSTVTPATSEAASLPTTSQDTTDTSTLPGEQAPEDTQTPAGPPSSEPVTTP